MKESKCIELLRRKKKTLAALTNPGKTGIVGKKEAAMKDLQKDIQTGNWKSVYLLFGEEDYLRQQYKNRLLKALNPQEDTMNYSMFSGKDIHPEEIIDLAETMPFFSDRRVIYIEDSGFFKNKCEKLPEYLAELPEYLVLIFCEREVDKRSRMYKAVTKNGRAVEFKKQSDSTLMRWVLTQLKQENKKITQPDMELFLSRTGTDMSRIHSELEKLICYCADDEVITREAILDITTEKTENQIFEMVKAITERRQKQALTLYYDLLELKEPPMRILFLIARQYNILLQVREMMQQHLGTDEIAAKLGMQSFIVRKAIPVAQKYTTKQLKKAVETMVNMEEDVKNGRITDTLSVELLIVRYSTASKQF